MNTLISIALGIVLNFLGIEAQERKELAQLEQQDTIENHMTQSIEITHNNCEAYIMNQSKIEHKCKLSK